MSLLPEKTRYVRGLRITKEAETTLLAHLDRQSERFNGRNHRQDPRHAYRTEDGLRVQVFHPAGVEAPLLVVSRNISRRGLAFLHSSYIHLGSHCVVALEALDGELVQIRGEVVRCSHVRGNVHEIAIRFPTPIDLSDFVVAYLDTNQPPEEDPGLSTLDGRVLYVEDSVDDRELVSFLLRKHGLDICAVDSPSEAFERLGAEGYDLVLTDLHLSGMSGPRVIRSLRNHGFSGPIIAVTADENQATKEEVLAEGCTHVLVKPYGLRDLLGLLCKHLTKHKSAAPVGDPLTSSLWSDLSMRPLILRFLDRLAEKVQRLGQLMEAEDLDHLQQLCHELKGSAKGYGYGQISRAARELQKLATTGAPTDEIRAQVKELADLCHAACRYREDAAASPEEGTD